MVEYTNGNLQWMTLPSHRTIVTLCACTIAVLHEQWMCLGMQRNTHVTGNNLIPISVPIHFVDDSYMYI